jgi:hypothetical protein
MLRILATRCVAMIYLVDWRMLINETTPAVKQSIDHMTSPLTVEGRLVQKLSGRSIASHRAHCASTEEKGGATEIMYVRDSALAANRPNGVCIDCFQPPRVVRLYAGV